MPPSKDFSRQSGQWIQRKWKIFFLVAVSIFMSTLDSSIVNVALPVMMKDFSTNVTVIQWVVLVYLTTVSSLLLTFGRLSDIIGRKPIYILGFCVFVLGSLFCGLAYSPWVLIAARVVQGGGAAMLMACSPALIVDAFPVKERGRALGLVGAVVAAGLTTGPVVGGFLLDFFSWRYIFYINIPIGIAASLGAMLILKQMGTNKETQKFSSIKDSWDKAGSILLVFMLTTLIIFLSKMNEAGVYSLFSLSIAGLFILSLIAFIVVEKKADHPIFDFNLFKIRLFIFPIMGSAILFAALFSIVFLMPFYLTYPCGFSSSKIGGIMLVPFLFLLFVSPASGALYDRLGSRKICMSGMGAMTLSLIMLTTLTPTMGIGSILWRTALAGLGTALYISPNNTAIMNAVPAAQRGIASGTVATARNLGMVLGVALAGLVFSSSYSALSHGNTLENYQPLMEPVFMISFKRAMIMGACLSMIGLIVTYARGNENISKKAEVLQ